MKRAPERKSLLPKEGREREEEPKIALGSPFGQNQESKPEGGTLEILRHHHPDPPPPFLLLQWAEDFC